MIKKHVSFLGQNLFTIFLILSLLLSACGAEELPAEEPVINIEQSPIEETATELAPDEEPVVEEPEINQPPEITMPPGPEFLETIIPDTTEVLSSEVAKQYDLEITQGETENEIIFTFAAGIDDQISLSAGNVIAMDPTDDAPDGLLRRVIDVTRGNGGVEVRTVQASLEEAIHTAEIHESIMLAVDERTEIEQSNGGRLARVVPARAQDLTLTINEDFEGVRVTGRVTFQPSFDIEMIIQNHKLELLQFVNTTVTNGKLEVESNVVEAGFNRRKNLFPAKSLSPIPIPIGKLRIWLMPELAVYVGVDGSVSAGLTMSVSQNMTLNSGFIYTREDGAPRPIFMPSLDDFRSEPPTFSTEVNSRAYIRPELKLKVFGVEGPFAGVDAYLNLEAGPSRTPWWEIFGGVRATVGVRLKIFSFAIRKLEWEESLLDKKWSLLKADTAAPLPETSSPGVASQVPVFGPANGSLVHELDDLVEGNPANIDLRDFVAEVTFYTPDPTSKASWDFGFVFRHAGSNDQLRLVIESDGDWSLEDWRGDISSVNNIDGGRLFNLELHAGGANQLKLVALGNQGTFYLNGSFIAPLDLSNRNEPGDILVATELRTANEVDGGFSEYEGFTVWSLPPIFGPTSGSLIHEADSFVEETIARVDLRDFIAEATLSNPYPTTRGSWDFGFLFRHIGFDEQLRLIIESDGNWSLADWRGDNSHVDYLDGGHLSNLNVSGAGSNRLRLVALGDQGLFFINDQFIKALDLSSRMDIGDVLLTTDLITAYEIDGEVTKYEDFTIWSLPQE